MIVIISDLKYLGKKGTYHLVDSNGQTMAKYKDGNLIWSSVIYMIYHPKKH